MESIKFEIKEFLFPLPCVMFPKLCQVDLKQHGNVHSLEATVFKRKIKTGKIDVSKISFSAQLRVSHTHWCDASKSQKWSCG